MFWKTGNTEHGNKIMQPNFFFPRHPSNIFIEDAIKPNKNAVDDEDKSSCSSRGNNSSGSSSSSIYNNNNNNNNNKFLPFQRNSLINHP
ncbi:hypothetical protein PoB_000238700 [Plakobranchus ocellatus]|uniref:Uncharacterized protein n=1 Tax=Plakobranchus ocellatus TaxID=259542 RepID=A0AAV3Y0B7_9GAST|nr:hypothetical protein PoB_000238700 [Plakobranchus ocellatus]